MERHDVIVVGGGAAGMMAAGCAAERGKSVLILEKNQRLGEKLRVTGGGRCNITNAEFDSHLLLKNYGKAASFLYSPFSQFGVQETFDFFESKGLPLVVEEYKRAFPYTEKASDVCTVMETYIRTGRVTVETNVRVKRVAVLDARVTSVSCDSGDYYADAFILATGGMSHPQTGSTGDGFTWLRNIGHTVHTPTPTIVPLTVREKIVQKLAGVSLPQAKVSYYLNGKKSFSKKGPLLFTHVGISGPVVLNSSGKVSDLLHAGAVTALIDCIPEKDEKMLDREVVALFDAHKNKVLKNVFSRIAPVQLLSCIRGLDPDTKVHSITREHRQALVRTLKALPLTVTALMGLDRAVVVDGGVDISQIENRTMRSKLYSNLYIVGDLLHINRPTGGYSLQLCWTSGWVAGKSV